MVTMGIVPIKVHYYYYYYLFVPDPPSCVRQAPKICVHVKNPIFINYVLAAGGMETREHSMHIGKENAGFNAVLWLLAFSVESSPNFPCNALGQDSYLI